MKSIHITTIEQIMHCAIAN